MSSLSNEYYNTYNPAFCSIVLYMIIKGYYQSRDKFPWHLSFIVLPILLSKKIRSNISVKTKFHPWIMRNEFLRPYIQKGIENLSEVVKESLTFGISKNLFNITSDGDIELNRMQIKNIWDEKSDAFEIFKNAKSFGKWIGKDSPSNIYQFVGVQI